MCLRHRGRAVEKGSASVMTKASHCSQQSQGGLSRCSEGDGVVWSRVSGTGGADATQSCMLNAQRGIPMRTAAHAATCSDITITAAASNGCHQYSSKHYSSRITAGRRQHHSRPSITADGIIVDGITGATSGMHWLAHGNIIPRLPPSIL